MKKGVGGGAKILNQKLEILKLLRSYANLIQDCPPLSLKTGRSVICRRWKNSRLCKQPSLANTTEGQERKAPAQNSDGLRVRTL